MSPRRKVKRPTKLLATQRRLAAVEWSLVKAYEACAQLQAQAAAMGPSVVRERETFERLQELREFVERTALPKVDTSDGRGRLVSRSAYDELLAGVGARLTVAVAHLAQGLPVVGALAGAIVDQVGDPFLRARRVVDAVDPPPHTDAEAPRLCCGEFETGSGEHDDGCPDNPAFELVEEPTK
jgi:hypothetical protein